MESWYKVTLPMNECGVGGKDAELQNAFTSLFIAQAGPHDAAMFTKNDEDEDFKRCILYFSPGAVRIAQALIERFGGVPCPAPKELDLIFLVGDDRARNMLSPKSGSDL